MVLNSTTFGYLAAHDSIKKDLNPLGAANIILTDEDVKAYLERKLKLKIAFYDEILRMKKVLQNLSFQMSINFR